MRLYEERPSGTVARARELRHAASPIERRLLRALRETFPLLKWRHQVPVGPYYADVLCFSERLVIEVDGDTHAEMATYDATRTRFIERKGFRVLRFANGEVIENLEGVLTQISSLREKEGAPQARKDEGEHLKRKGDAA